MKRTIKRRLSILLALVMLFSLLPTLSAPVSAEPAPTAIDSVGVSLTRPVVGPSSVTGDGVPGEATITAGEHSSVEKVRWYKGEGEGIGLGDFVAFENGKQYFAEIYLTAEDDYAFTDDTAVTLSGAEKKATDVRDGGKTLYICTENITPTPVYKIAFDLNGGTASMPLAPTTYNPDEGLPALPGIVTPPESKVFDAWEIDGTRYEVGAKYVATSDFTIKALWKDPPATSTISSVALSVTEPTAGATVPSYIVDVNNAGVSAESGANYTVVESGWLQNDGAGGSEYTTDTEFQAGKTYLLFATLSPNEGYQFSEECTGKVNGAAADDHYRRTPDLIVYKEFTIPAAETTYPVWVGSTQVTSANKDNILGDTGTPTAVYDPETHTLTLNDPTIMGEPSSASGAKIYIYDSSVTYTIDGTATIDGDIVMGNGWTADLVIKGNITAKRVVNPDHSVTVDGNLTLNSSSVFALRASSITIASGTVDVTGVDYGIEGSTVTISGGTVTAKASSSTGSAIHANTALSIAATHEIVLPAGGVLSSDGKDVCKSDGTTIATEAKIAPKETITEYPVWVGGVQLTSENIDGTAIPGVKYDPSTFTLTLTDADITGAYGVVGIRSEGIDLVIEGKGIVMASGAVGIAVSKKDGSGGSLTIDADLSVSGIFGMNVENTLTIKGGELTISLSASASTAITAGAVDVQGGTVWANSSGSYAFNVSGDFKISAGDVTAQYGNYGIYAGGDVEITGGTLTVDSALYGISAGGNMEITGGMVTAKSNGSTGKGIMAENGDITISGASTKVIAEGTKKGILAGGDITISGGTVTAKGGEEGIEAGTGTITISGGTVVAEATGSSGIGIHAKGKITVSGDGTAVTGKAPSGSCGVRTDGAIEVNGGSLEGKCAETGYGIYADDGISFAATHEIVIPEGGTLSESSKTIFASGGGGVAAHAKIAPKEVTYPVWVQGIQVKDSNKDNVLGDGKVVFTPASGSTPHTLTLSGASISDTTEKPAIYTMDADLLVTGSATISVTNDHSGIRMDKDESSGGTLTLENAQLTISGGSIHDAIDAYNMSIENSTVEITGFSGGIRTNGGDLTISGSTVNAACTNFGFHVDGTLTIANDITSVHAKSTSATALSAMYGKTIVLGDQLMIKTPEGGEIGTGLGELYHGQVIFESGGTTQAKEVLIVPKEVTYPVWVGGMQVKDSNKTDILGDGTAKFDPATNTLTLDGLNVGDGLHASGASIVSTGIDLTVTGSATLTGSGYGIYVINLFGGGSLTLDKAEITYAGDSASDVGVKADGDITIKDSKLELSAANNGVCAGGAISIDGGTVKAEATDANNGTAIEAAGDISISNADVTATAGNGPFTTGVYSETGDITISGGTVTATAGGGGVYAFGGEVKIENGTEKVEATVGTVAVRGKTGVTIGDELMIKLPEGGEVKSKSGFYEIMDGTDTARHALIVPKEATVYTVTFDANSGSGTMTPNPVTVVAGKKLTLPACTFTPPSADTEFDKWDAGKPGDEVEITSDCVIRAIWKEKTAPVTYTVTVTDDGNGTATASPASGASGDEVTLTATPKSGYKFKEWKVVSGGVTVTDNKFKIGTANVEIQAIFEEETAPGTYTVTVTDDGNGTATATPASGASGDEVTLTATPKSGYKFKEWKVVSGGVTVTDNKFKIGTANVEIQAVFEKETAPVPAVYTVVGGGDSEWTKGSGKTLTVTVKRDPNDSECFSHFASVELGGKTLTAGTDYDAKSGSTIVTIKAAALEKLAAGKHTISILFDDGKAETKVTIKAGAAAGAKDSSPKTGQERTMIIWVPLMLVSGLGLCAVLITDKKRRPAGRH